MKRYPALFLMICALLTACAAPTDFPVAGPSGVIPSSEPEAVAAYSPSNLSIPEEEPEENAPALNLLTGQRTLRPESSGRRPVAVMVSNIKAALPQYGIGGADLYFETLAEGGITRIMAVFADGEQMPKIGPVRSARDYFLDLAAPMNAVFVHIGASSIADAAIAARGLDNVNGLIYTSEYFTKDLALANAKGQEHSFFTSGQDVMNAWEDGVTSMTGATASPFSFVERPFVPDGPGREAVLKFSGITTARFLYDEGSGLYQKEQFGAPQIDAATGETLAVENLIVLTAPVSLAKGYSGGLLSIDLSAGGSGYYIAKGGSMPITWKKGDYSSPLALYDAQGEPLSINPGRSYVAILPRGDSENISLA